MARLISLAIAALFAVALLVTLITRGLAPLPSPPVIRLELNMPPGVEAGMTNSPNLAISPDGTRVAFAGVLGGRRLLYVRRFDEFEAVPIKGTETVNVVCFSPDGTALAFISSERVLKTVSLADGLVTPLDSDADYTGGGLAWSAGGLITFGSRGTLWQVPWTGGTRRQLTTLDSKQNERLHAWPTALPNDKAILLTSVTGGERIAMHIESLSLATGERQRVTNNGSSPIYAPSGHLLYFRDGSVLAAPFSLDTLRVTGAAVAVLDNIALDQLGNPLLTLSGAGQLAFIPSGSATKQLVWVSRQGVEQTITDISRPYQNPRLAPDGHRIAVEVAGGDLWMADSTRATFQLLTTKQTAGNTFAVWTPDAKRIVFRTVTGLHWIDPDSGGAAHPIPDTSVSDIPTSISPDSQTLAFIRQSSTTRTAGDIYVLSLNGDPKPHPVVETNGYDGGGQFSPDGNWLAYVSNETGQFEVYVRPFPSAGRRHPVSTQGGTHPRWNRNGKELFYRSGNKMMVVDVTTDTELRISQPHMLFERRYAFGSAQSVPNYDVSPDGQHFLMVKDESSSGRLNVVLNWFEELKRLVPAN